MTPLSARVGIVVVSHSSALADAAVALALEMTPVDPPTVRTAAGTADGRTGTDAMLVAEAISAVAAASSGVLVLTDLGSAVLSAEMALEFADVGSTPVRVSSAPLVEGLLAAVVTAAGGAPLTAVESEARGALAAKESQLQAPDADDSPQAPPEDAAGSAERRGEDREVTVRNRDGLHARPAALIVGALAGKDATLTLARADGTDEPVRVAGPIAILALGVMQGERLRLHTEGPDAGVLADAVVALFEGGFGEPMDVAASPAEAAEEPWTTGNASPSL